MHRTRRRLADGRQIVYYDPQPGTGRSAHDVRDLLIAATRSEIRHGAVLHEWVVIAGHRQARTFLSPADLCPLCPSRPGRPSEIPEAGYEVVVFENRFPSLTAEAGVEVVDLPPVGAMTHRQVPDLPALDDAERDDLAAVYLDVLRRLYDAPLSLLSCWQQDTVRVDRDLAYLHLELFSIRRAADKLKYLAGSESGMGVFVSDVVPEEVAARLRTVGG